MLHGKLKCIGENSFQLFGKNFTHHHSMSSYFHFIVESTTEKLGEMGKLLCDFSFLTTCILWVLKFTVVGSFLTLHLTSTVPLQKCHKENNYLVCIYKAGLYQFPYSLCLNCVCIQSFLILCER